MRSARAKGPRLGADAWVECIFLDVVSYSKRRTDSQTAIINALNRIVKNSIRTHRLRPDQRIFIPTGDGMCVALLNVGDPVDIQMQIALGILEGLHEHNSRTPEEELRFEVRVGINTNRDNVFIDINGNPNVAGKGINFSARIMDQADGGQILVGNEVFKTLSDRTKYVGAFRPFTTIVKGNVPIELHQFIGGGHSFLNVNVPTKLRTLADLKAGSSEGRRALRTDGLTVRVEIGPSDAEVRWARVADVALSKPLRIAALIDTGASRTVINPQVAITCGLRQVGEAVISTAGMVGRFPEYVGSIRFPESKLSAADPVRFIACPLPKQSVSCLIGRDVLEQWRLVYDGRTGEAKIEG